MRNFKVWDTVKFPVCYFVYLWMQLLRKLSLAPIDLFNLRRQLHFRYCAKDCRFSNVKAWSISYISTKSTMGLVPVFFCEQMCLIQIRIGIQVLLWKLWTKYKTYLTPALKVFSSVFLGTRWKFSLLYNFFVVR